MIVSIITHHAASKKDLEVLQRLLTALGVWRGRPRPRGPSQKISHEFQPNRFSLELGTTKNKPEQNLTVQVSDPMLAFQILKNSKIPGLPKEAPAKAFEIKLPSGATLEFSQLPDDANELEGISGNLVVTGKRFAIVVARFNSFITERLLQAAHDGLIRSGANKKDITIVRVPGAFEIPSAARTLAQSRKYDAILCIGCLLRGDTAHYDVIVNEVTRGIGQSAQETGIPHAFGVLTCDTLEQAIDRAGLKMGNKGLEAATAAIEMANLQEALQEKQARSTAALKKKRR